MNVTTECECADLAQLVYSCWKIGELEKKVCNVPTSGWFALTMKLFAGNALLPDWAKQQMTFTEESEGIVWHEQDAVEAAGEKIGILGSAFFRKPERMCIMSKALTHACLNKFKIPADDWHALGTAMRAAAEEARLLNRVPASRR